MKPRSSEEKVKPFRLVKYFTFTSLVIIFIGTIALSLLNTRWARDLQLRKSEDYARLLIENLNHQIFLKFVIPVALKFGKIQLRNKDQFEHMDKVVRTTLHSFKLDMVNIYDKNNTISYSFDPSVIGQKDLGGTGFQNALAGKSTSQLVQRGNFWEMLLGFPKESMLITFAPLRAEKPLSRISGPVLGVVEIRFWNFLFNFWEIMPFPFCGDYILCVSFPGGEFHVIHAKYGSLLFFYHGNSTQEGGESYSAIDEHKVGLFNLESTIALLNQISVLVRQSCLRIPPIS